MPVAAALETRHAACLILRTQCVGAHDRHRFAICSRVTLRLDVRSWAQRPFPLTVVAWLGSREAPRFRRERAETTPGFLSGRGGRTRNDPRKRGLRQGDAGLGRRILPLHGRQLLEGGGRNKGRGLDKH